MRVTIKQIAEQAGVSRGTVDRVLNHRGRSGRRWRIGCAGSPGSWDTGPTFWEGL